MKLKVEIFKDENSIPAAIRTTLKTLHSAGFEAYLAGGCVRDALLGRKPKDFDIATDASPGQVETIFEKTVSVGREFGVTIVIVPEGVSATTIEVATFRSDGEYRDGRHPESVRFSSAEEDAKRRDFTINGIFYDLKTGSVIDYVGGYEDLKKRTVKCIGSAKLRFTEDKLRIIRAVRFASELDFELEKQTRDVIPTMAKELHVVSAERITEEVNKMLGGSHPSRAFELLRSLGLSNIIFNNTNVFSSQKHFELLKFSLGLIEKDSALGWLLVAFFEMRTQNEQKSIQPDQVLAPFSQFRLSKDLLRTMEFCLREWDSFHRFDTPALMILDSAQGLALLQLATVVNVAESTLSGQPLSSKLDVFLKRYQGLSGANGQLEASWLNGNDLAKAGIPKGPSYKTILQEAYALQLDRKLSSREDALKWLETKKP